MSPTIGSEASAEREISEALWQPVMDLPCQLTVQVPLPNFRVGDFLALRLGSVIASAWVVSRDVPLRINGTLIGWGELEQAGKHLAVRLTELA
ncbi:MAG TPA: FliM/FliN family flagellar motor C-terminal domain-containing protein [Candidatus Sulfotelmatobacter sp.]|nr:FliM/FliN family flagellar motor C-terminal domain-containing protein [Candidatus Sulfotelmatobacter sp.]